MDFDFLKQKVLIVDDVPMNIQLLAAALKSDYQIKVATSGKKALEIATSQDAPDLIVLDIMMPEMDGYEVCKKLKSSHKTRNIPVIFITAKDDMEDEMKGLDLGAVDYIVKPFKMPIVKARLRTQLDLKRKTDMLEELVSLDGLTDIHQPCHDLAGNAKAQIALHLSADEAGEAAFGPGHLDRCHQPDEWRGLPWVAHRRGVL